MIFRATLFSFCSFNLTVIIYWPFVYCTEFIYDFYILFGDNKILKNTFFLTKRKEIYVFMRMPNIWF